jgi:hypothetical protein
MKIAVFSRGDIIVDKNQKLHGLILKNSNGILTIKWTQDRKGVVRETLLASDFVRKQMMRGNYSHISKEQL